VYQGIGGDYDVNRVEVLRGPQGTLYGRSATGGVVAFHTNNPKLDEFEAAASVEYGTADLRNYQAALNVPYGEKFAIRLAWHDFEKDGYHDNEDGKHTKTSEGRVKALYQPVDALDIMLTYSYQETTTNGGGYAPVLDSPDDINYTPEENYTEPMEGSPGIYNQVSLNVDYDFGGSSLAWIAGYHDYDSTGLGTPEVGGDGLGWHADETKWPTDYYHSEEVRLASNDDGFLTWLAGANYFKHEFDNSIYSVQTAWNPADTELDSSDYLAPIFGQDTDGTFENYGLFTEETFNLTDEFRVTAGLRYDKTKLVQNMYWALNTNMSSGGNNMNPPTWYNADPLIDDEHDWDNITYKLRLEYDLTPDSMIYALTATGFMPGYTALSPDVSAYFGTGSIVWNIIQFDQQKLTSYEIGTKNQFLNDTLRLNASVFYYDYEGYPEAVPVAMSGPSPVFGMFAVPLDVYGIELYAEYLITMNDKLTLDAGWLNAEISEYPSTVVEGVSYSSKEFLALEDLPGNPDLTASVAYDHTFTLGNGSQLVPRAELIYTGGYYLVQMTQEEIDAEDTDHNPLHLKDYNYQDAYVLVNIGATWTTASELFSVSGYVRNAFDEEYKTDVNLSTTGDTTVTPGDPRTFGLILSVRY
jgi:iron complex outermembrane receptor protein